MGYRCTNTRGGWPPSYKATGFGEDEYARLLKETLRMDELIRTHGAIMDSTILRRRLRWSSTNGARGSHPRQARRRFPRAAE